MKIEGMDGVGRPKQAEGVHRHQTARTSDPLEPQQPGDRVELSDRARKVAALADKAAGLPDVRREKVEALRRSLDDGVYRVDPRHVARKILEFEDVIGR